LRSGRHSETAFTTVDAETAEAGQRSRR